MAEVNLQDGETLESALRRFKRKVQQEDIIKEVKKHSYYMKPGEKKRVKAALARKRNRKKRSRNFDSETEKRRPLGAAFFASRSNLPRCGADTLVCRAETRLGAFEIAYRCLHREQPGEGGAGTAAGGLSVVQRT